MKLNLIIICLFLSPALLSAGCVSFHVEHATTQDEREWGLMGRSSLPEGYGMLFHYPNEQHLRFWAFNCFVDFSVAFLDKDGIVVDIQELKSHPEWMDPNRPIQSKEDFYRYLLDEATIKRFVEAGIVSRRPAQYALEVPAGWFKKVGVEIEDRLIWKEGRGLFIPHDGDREF